MKQYFERIDNAYASLSGGDLEKVLIAIAGECCSDFGEESVQYASVLSELGGYYRGQGRLKESVDHFTRAADLLSRLCGDDGTDYATALNNLAGTYRLAGDYNRAEALFQKVLGIYSRKVGKRSVLYASGLNNLSLVYLDRGDHDKAFAMQKESLEVLRGLPECRDELASGLCNLGAIYLNTGRFQDALNLYSEAAQMYEKELGTVTPHYHAAYNGIGFACFQSGDYAASVMAFEKAYQAANRLYGENHRETEAIKSSLQFVKSLCAPDHDD